MKEHKTNKIVIKKEKIANIDSKIIPVVNWLNSFESIITLFSCEGGDNCKDYPDKQYPYIMFYCDSSLDLSIVLDNVFSFASVKVEYIKSCGRLRYYMQFFNKNTLLIFLDGLKHKRSN